MRLIFAEIVGFGRIVNSKVNLDASLIAVVGPNEAGKSTFLTALSSMDKVGNISSNLVSRSSGFDDSQKLAVKCAYVLEKGDIEALGGLNLEENPKRIILSRGLERDTFKVDFDVLPVRSLSNLRFAAEKIGDALTANEISRRSNADTEDSNSEQKSLSSDRKELENVKASIETVIKTPGLKFPKQVIQSAIALRDVAQDFNDSGPEIVRALDDVIEWSKQGSVVEEVESLLRPRIPEFVSFSTEDRSFTPPYVLNKELIKNTPRSLNNLARAAGLDLASLLKHLSSSDESRWRSELHRANRQLHDIFVSSWKQSELTVEFSLNGNNLGIQLLENGHSVSVFSERSAGLKTFVALLAFLKARDSKRPVILLVDEAENHLHIDAQADLVNMFVQQEQAVKIIYTTHSPACLPPDLGTGIRVVAPVKDKDQVSEIRGSFWTSSTGFSPLMMAMGAGSAAFTPARRVVIAEGASDMILLPSLLRNVLDRDIDYQVAPGLSQASQTLMSNLGLEASRVAYLVDGDHGGRELKKSLASAGVSEKKIVTLATEGIEELVDVDNYLKVYSDLLQESDQGFEGFHDSEIECFKCGTQSVPKEVEKWVAKQNLKPPSKVAVATRLVETDLAVAQQSCHQELRRIDEEFESLLMV